MVIDNGFAICFEDRLGGHCERLYIRCNYAQSAFASLVVTETEISVGIAHICCHCSSLELYSILGISVLNTGGLVNLEESAESMKNVAESFGLIVDQQL